jgi:ureidoglycolate hydrolase
MDERLLEIKEYMGEGYQPLIQFGDWRVAILRWEELLQPDQIKVMERHTQTDEVFVLLEGQATLILGGMGGMVEGVYPQGMENGKLYNVKQGVWHTVLISRDAAILIVEDRDTGKENTEFNNLTEEFRKQIVGLGRVK